jgi:transcriptional regulator GlxA family with amidase domain
LIETLGLDEQLCRILTLLAVPAARRVPMEQRRLANGSDDTATEMEAEQLFDRDAFEALIAYINANLDQPLNLTLLQNHIHYSRRALQYAFRQRLGCTATQWIRGQRLDKAHRLLGHAAPGESVASIAQACGYRSMSLFSIEFQQRFHIKPSVLLREARSSSGHANPERTEPSQADQASGL